MAPVRKIPQLLFHAEVNATQKASTPIITGILRRHVASNDTSYDALNRVGGFPTEFMCVSLNFVPSTGRANRCKKM